jgi:hypothetical protein
VFKGLFVKKQSRLEIWGAVAAATGFESLAAAQFIRRGGHPLQRPPRRNELLCYPTFDLRRILPLS